MDRNWFAALPIALAAAFTLSAPPALSLLNPFSTQLLPPPIEGSVGDWGRKLATAGDVNGDGFDELLVTGHFLRDYEWVDEAWLYYGGAGGVDAGAPLRIGMYDTLNENLVSVAAAGDVDGDGYGDVLVGAPFLNTAPFFDTTFLYRGGPEGLSTTPLWYAPDEFGTGLVVSGAGDVNGDDYADFVLTGSYFDGLTFQSVDVAYVFHGGPGGPGEVPDTTLTLDQDRMRFGSSYAPAGDVNGDGYDDLLVYCDRASWMAGDGPATVVALYFGSSEGLSADPAWRLLEDPAMDFQMAHGRVATGDVNGDGLLDLLFGVPSWGEELGYEGKAFLFLGDGETFSSTPSWSYASGWSNAWFGESVGVSDIDGDGYDDLLIGGGQWGYDFTSGEAEESVGGLFVFFGSPEGVDDASRIILRGGPEDFYGRFMCAAGDLNGDGRTDAAVTSVSFTGGEPSGDTVEVLYGESRVKRVDLGGIGPLCFVESLSR